MEQEIITVTGVISRVLDKISDNKTHFEVDTSNFVLRNNNNMLECRAYKSSLHLYMPVIITGTYVENNVFDVQSIKTIWINEEVAINYVSFRVRHSGVGKVAVRKMVNKLGPDILNLDKESLRLKLIEYGKDLSLSNTKINNFLNAFYSGASIAELEPFLGKYGVEYKIIAKIDEDYEKSAITEFKKDPYKICLKYNIHQFVAESIAKEVGFKPDCDKRIEGLICYYLTNRASSGHSFTPAKIVAKEVMKMSKKAPYYFNLKPIYIANICLTSKKIHFDDKNGYISLRYLHNQEKAIALRLKAIDCSLESHIKITDNDINDIQQKFGIEYGTEQRQSFKLLESHGVNILTGGPGTGKTATIRGIVEMYKKFNPGKIVMFCAPTGRAAKRLSESVGYEAKTIHKLLEYQPFRSDPVVRNASNPLECDFLIMDEGSMAEIEMLAMLLTALPNGARFLIVGDEHQLPSVGAGNCLHDIIASNKYPVYRLTEVFRQEGDSSIIDNSRRILRGQMPIANDIDFIIKKCATRKEAYDMLCQMMKFFYDKKNPFKTQMIEPSKKDFDGTYMINKYVHSNIVFNSNDGYEVDSSIQPGDKIIFTQNVYTTIDDKDNIVYNDKGEAVHETKSIPLYVNGEMGIVTHLSSEEVTIDDGTGEEKILKKNALADAELAYSYTIHKSQGSEASIVIIYLPYDKKYLHMLTNSLLYTAITRAKDKVIIVYTEDALSYAITNFTDVQRDTRLKEFILDSWS